MSNNTNYCGSSKTMGQGDVAVCGRVWWASVYQCDKCKLKDAEALITKQYEQIKMLRSTLIDTLTVVQGGLSSTIANGINALEATKEQA